MKPFKWIKNHPFESLALLAAAGTGLGAAGIGPMAGLFAGEAGAAGAAGGAGSLLGGGAGASALLGDLAFGGVGQAAGIAGGTLGAEFGGMTAAQAAGAGVGQVGGAGGSLVGAAKGFSMSPKQAMMLAQMAGGGQQEQRPMGAPQDMGNPMQRQAMMTQEQITKRWLLENDPNTYARIYGAPQGASYG